MKKSVFLIYPVDTTFIKKDEIILQKHCKIRKHHFKSTKNPVLLSWELIKLLFVSLLYVPKSDIVYNWFIGYHTLFPCVLGKLLGKKNIIVVAGYDGVSIPSIKFGVFWKKNAMTWFAIKSYQLADYILTVDKSLEKGMNYFADPSGKGYPIGVRNFVSNLKAQFYNIPFGFDTERWKPNPSIERKPAVISIGVAPTMQIFQRKGFDFLIETAKLLPGVKFTIVGLSGKMLEYAKQIVSDNVDLVGKVPFEQLPDILSAHKVFAQLSMSEGQPNTLCEAMANGCIPVGSDVNGIPVSIDQYGFVLKKKDAKLAADLIQKALDAPSELGNKARQHIIDNYPADKREQLLLKYIQ